MILKDFSGNWKIYCENCIEKRLTKKRFQVLAGRLKDREMKNQPHLRRKESGG
jgi:hypothetical protein